MMYSKVCTEPATSQMIVVSAKMDSWAELKVCTKLGRLVFVPRCHLVHHS